MSLNFPFSLCAAFLSIVSFTINAQNSAPQIAINTVSVDEISRTVQITFNLNDAENDVCNIYLSGSADGGLQYSEITENLNGSFGPDIMPGLSLNLTWTYPENLDIFDYQLRLTADDGVFPGISEIINDVDSNSIQETLAMIEGERHYLSNPEHLNRVRDSLETRFEAYNLETSRETFNFSTITGQNIIGKQKGFIQTNKTYIIDGHYDGVIGSPAADDNGSAVAGMLEAARILKNYQFKNTISFIGFDLEESGLIGSQRYVQQLNASNEDIAGVINFEMIGYYSSLPNSQTVPQGFELLFPNQVQSINAEENRGNFIISCGNQNSGPLVTAFESAAAEFVPQLRLISLTVPGNGNITPDLRRSDHAPFWDAGKQALMITDGANFRNPHYHTPGDTLSTLNFTFMTNVVKAAIATIIQLAEPLHAGFATVDLAPLSTKNHNHDINLDLSIYPNPANDKLYIRFNAPHEMNLQTSIFSLKGELIQKKIIRIESREPQELSLKNIASGNYIFMAESGEFVFRKEIQIQR